MVYDKKKENNNLPNDSLYIRYFHIDNFRAKLCSSFWRAPSHNERMGRLLNSPWSFECCNIYATQNRFLFIGNKTNKINAAKFAIFFSYCRYFEIFKQKFVGKLFAFDCEKKLFSSYPCPQYLLITIAHCNNWYSIVIFATKETFNLSTSGTI